MVASSDAESAPSTPSATEIDAIASRRFSTSFRGWNVDEVRVHLVAVAEIVRSLSHRQGELERLLVEAEAAARRADLTRLDPDEVARILGEETARVLRTARDSAAEIEAKAAAQAELIVGQAADEAATLRTRAQAESAEILADAREAAAATRAAGEAHVEDLRQAVEADVANDRQTMEDELAAERQAARDEGASQLAAAEDHATQIRLEADQEAERIVSEADAAATAARAALDDELTQRAAEADAKVRDLERRGAIIVAEAEAMRERILADLARKRRAARQHLEQLHAGRDRLLTAYEVIRATTDQATGELSVVLDDAKRAADEAARRVGGESLPTPEEMLADLEMAKMADLPIVSVAVVDDLDVEPVGASAGLAQSDEAVAVESAGSVQEGVAGTPAEDVGEVTNGDAGDSADEQGESAPGIGASDPSTESLDGVEVPDAEAVALDDVADEPGATAMGSTVVAAGESGPDDAASTTSPKRSAHRRQGRRGKHRHDPLDGDELPEGSMTPVDAAADFESVRVVAVDEPAVSESAPAPNPSLAPAPSPAPAELEPPAASAERALVAVGSLAAAEAPTTAPARETAAREAPARETPAKPSQPPIDDAGSVEGSRAVTSEDVSGIFARLRAAQDPGDDAGHEAPTSTPSPASTDASTVEPTTATAPPIEAKAGSAKQGPAKAGSAKQSPAQAGSAKAGSAKQSPAEPGPDRSKASQRRAESDESPAAPRTPAKAGSDVASPAQAKPKGTRRASATAATERSGSSNDERLAVVFERRDAAVDEVARRLAKHLKRHLSDHQSALLDELRRHRGVPTADDALGDPGSFADTWLPTIREDLAGAVAAGAALAGDLRDDVVAVGDVDLDATSGELVESIAGPLRARLVRALGDRSADPDDESTAAADDLELADRVRACYREWRGVRLATAAADACSAAFGLGVRAAVPPSVGLRWVCGPTSTPCADCNDNELAGDVPPGEVFPTGQLVAPAHPGCTCLALPI